MKRVTVKKAMKPLISRDVRSAAVCPSNKNLQVILQKLQEEGTKDHNARYLVRDYVFLDPQVKCYPPGVLSKASEGKEGRSPEKFVC